MRGRAARSNPLSLLRALLCALLMLPAVEACGFDSQPVRARIAANAGTGANAGQSGRSGQGGNNGGSSGNAGSGANDRDGALPDAGPPGDAGRDAGPTDSGPPGDAQIPDDGGDAPITCIPNLTRTCYSGPTGTRGVGVCRAGTHRCKSNGAGFGPCTGEVLPSPDVCTNDLDDDCDGTVNDGFPDGEGCVCEPGAQKECYTGPAAFKGIGNCTLGAITCNAQGSAWSACSGDVLPTAPRCALADRDCNGISDDQQDLDGDGFGLCDTDCCDRTEDGCSAPARVNPGAYDIAGNGVDDDCTGTADDALLACDGTVTAATTDAFDYAKALDLCQRTMSSLPRSAQRWGVLNATLTLADGNGAPRPAQRLLRSAFGAIGVQRGARMVTLSTGHAATPGEVNPAFEPFEPGKELGTMSAMPADWLAANGGEVQQVPGCPASQISAIDVMDSAMLTLTVRVPTNMRAFALRAYLLSAEFPEYVCDERNDYALALLTSSVGAPTNPSDKNLATFTTAGGVRYPLGPTLAFGNTGAFRQCRNGTLSCEVNGEPISQITTCQGTSDLASTGFEQSAQAGTPPCDANSQIGGGTGWLTIYGNVAPGETIELRLIIWDTGDAEQDSVVLFDQFEWSSEPVKAGISL